MDSGIVEVWPAALTFFFFFLKTTAPQKAFNETHEFAKFDFSGAKYVKWFVNSSFPLSDHVIPKKKNKKKNGILWPVPVEDLAAWWEMFIKIPNVCLKTYQKTKMWIKVTWTEHFIIILIFSPKAVIFW